MSELLVLSHDDVRALVDRAALLDALLDGFQALERGEVQTPPRPQITTPHGFSLSMPAWRSGGPMAVKQVSDYAGNPERGLPSHMAIVTLLDEDTAAPVCVMDGASITALRTAGAAMVAARLAARPDARRAVVVGAGVQGPEHVAYLPAALPGIDHVVVWSLRRSDAERVAEAYGAAVVDDLEETVRAADVVLLCSASHAAVIDDAWVQPGTHVSSVGYAPPVGELPVELARRADRLLVETMDAFEPMPVGCGELAGVDRARALPLGAAASPVRRNAHEITVYKAMGNAMEDLVTATLAYRAALAVGVGERVNL